MDWIMIAQELDDLAGDAFDRKMASLSAEIDEDGLRELLSAIGELYADCSDDETRSEQYSDLCYFCTLAYGNVHYSELSDEDYTRKMTDILRSVGLDTLAEYCMASYISFRTRQGAGKK